MTDTSTTSAKIGPFLNIFPLREPDNLRGTRDERFNTIWVKLMRLWLAQSARNPFLKNGDDDRLPHREGLPRSTKPLKTKRWVPWPVPFLFYK